jgi:acetyl-CoA acetyltransferase
MTLKDKVAIAGIGETEFTRHVPRNALQMALEASLLAIQDAGLNPKDIDGIIPPLYGVTVQELASNLGIEPTYTFTCNPHIGGASMSAGLKHAALAIATGQAKAVLVAFSMEGYSGPHNKFRDGATATPGWTPEYRSNFEHPYGSNVPAHIFSLWPARHMALYGTTSEHLGHIAVTFRQHANLNDKAYFKDRPMTLEDHQASPYLVYPLRLFDFSLEIDGGAAVVVTSAEYAKDLKQQRVLISGFGEGHYGANEQNDRPNFFDHGIRYATPRALRMAGIELDDLDTAYVYDGFTAHTLWFIEEVGWVKRGEAGPFVAEGNIGLGGKIPLNTHGGNMSGAHLIGFNGLTELVKQLRGTAGRAQVNDAEVAMHVQEGNMGDGAVTVLTRG